MSEGRLRGVIARQQLSTRCFRGLRPQSWRRDNELELERTRLSIARREEELEKFGRRLQPIDRLYLERRLLEERILRQHAQAVRLIMLDESAAELFDEFLLALAEVPTQDRENMSIYEMSRSVSREYQTVAEIWYAFAWVAKPVIERSLHEYMASSNSELPHLVAVTPKR